MAKALMLFLLLAFLGGCDAQFTMTQSPSMSASIGETVKITCRRSSGSISSYRNSWYQQKPGSAPVLLIYADRSTASGISDRFSGSRDSSANAAVLTISSVQIEDEADYYCLSYDSSLVVFGGGTRLEVTGQPVVPPTVHVFPPSAEEMKTTNKATMVCMMSGFHPGVVQVDWLADGNVITEGVETAKPSKQNDKYVASSYLTLNNSDWERHQTFTCKVTHEGKPITKSVDRSECS